MPVSFFFFCGEMPVSLLAAARVETPRRLTDRLVRAPSSAALNPAVTTWFIIKTSGHAHRRDEQ
jgi:hypothetical protein